ncbi:hypothetical protein V8E53_004708 [Lactarius tabidus]
MAPPLHAPRWCPPCWVGAPGFPLPPWGSRHPASARKPGTQGGPRKDRERGTAHHSFGRRPRSCTNWGLSFAPLKGTGVGLRDMPPPSPICEEGAGMGCHGRRGTPLLARPPRLPLVRAHPPSHATRHVNGGVQRGRGHANCLCMPPPPLAAWPIPVRTPVGAPPLCATCAGWGRPVSSPFHARGSRHPASPLAPAQPNRTARAQDPPAPLPLYPAPFGPQQGTETRARGTTPAPLHPAHARTHARERGPRTGRWGWPLPHSRVFAKRARGWTATWDMAPSPLLSPPCPVNGVRRRCRPHFHPLPCPVRAKQGAPRMRGTRARPPRFGGWDQEEGAHTGMDRERHGIGVCDRRGCEDGSRHASGTAAPPSVCVWGFPSPFHLAPMHVQRGRANGGCAEPEDESQTGEGGSAPPPFRAMHHAGAGLNPAGGALPPALQAGYAHTGGTCEHDPARCGVHDPLHTPPFRMPRARRPACGTACTGVARGVVLTPLSQVCSGST